jgi:hypothetical protein
LTNPVNPNIINFDLWKQAAGGRHQIGTMAGFRSEQVAGFLLECMAGFVGIRSRQVFDAVGLLAIYGSAKRVNARCNSTIARVIAVAICEERGAQMIDVLETREIARCEL